MVWGDVIMAIKDFVIKPYNDRVLEYDYDLHQYIPTEDFIINDCAWGTFLEAIGGSENGLWYRKLLSTNAYQYIKSFKDAKFRKRLEYYLSHSKSARQDLIELMKNLVTYNLQEGGMMMAYVTGINLQEAQNITTIHYKTLVGLVGHQFVVNHGLAEKEFRYEFNLDGNYGTEW
jgi:hypothetical protein